MQWWRRNRTDNFWVHKEHSHILAQGKNHTWELKMPSDFFNPSHTCLAFPVHGWLVADVFPAVLREWKHKTHHWTLLISRPPARIGSNFLKMGLDSPSSPKSMCSVFPSSVSKPSEMLSTQKDWFHVIRYHFNINCNSLVYIFRILRCLTSFKKLETWTRHRWHGRM